MPSQFSRGDHSTRDRRSSEANCQTGTRSETFEGEMTGISTGIGISTVGVGLRPVLVGNEGSAGDVLTAGVGLSSIAVMPGSWAAARQAAIRKALSTSEGV